MKLGLPVAGRFGTVLRNTILAGDGKENLSENKTPRLMSFLEDFQASKHIASLSIYLRFDFEIYWSTVFLYLGCRLFSLVICSFLITIKSVDCSPGLD